MTSTTHPAAKRALLTGLLLTVTLHAFHAMAVVTIVPLAVADLDGRRYYGLFFAVYLLATLLGLVFAGRRIGGTGPKLVLGAGFAAFATGLVGAGLAPSMEGLVVARAIEGFGGGVVTTVIYAVVNRAYDADARPRVLAWLSSAWVLPGLVGPPAAGLIAETWGWRWVFLGVLPAVALAAALVLPTLRGLGTGDAGHRASRATGGRALALVMGLGLLLHSIAQPPDIFVTLLAGASAVVVVGAARLILPDGVLLARPVLPAAIAAKLLLNFAFFGTEAFLPLALTDVRGWSTFGIGTVLTTGALAWTAGALSHARLAPRVTARASAGIGGVALLGGIAGLLVLLGTGLPDALVHGAWALTGFGMGLTYNTTAATAMDETSSGDEGETSTALGMADALGFGLAAGLGGAVLAAGDRAGLTTGSSIDVLYGLMSAMALLTLWAATRMHPGPGRLSGPVQQAIPVQVEPGRDSEHPIDDATEPIPAPGRRGQRVY